MPNVQTQYGIKNKVRIHWVLGRLDGTLVLDSEGKPMETVGIYNASVSEKSELTKRVKQILNGPFPLITGADGTEQLAQILIGRSSLLLLAKVDNPRDPNDPYVNVDGIAPVPANSRPPAIPAGYVRRKDRPKTQAGPQGTPVQTYATPPGAQANVNVSFAPAPAPTANKPF
jgi:hypothetical protein